MTIWTQVCAESVIVKNWPKRLYLSQIGNEIDPHRTGDPDAGTLKKELDQLVFQGTLTKKTERIVDKDHRARRVVCYEPTPRLLEEVRK